MGVVKVTALAVVAFALGVPVAGAQTPTTRYTEQGIAENGVVEQEGRQVLFAIEMVTARTGSEVTTTTYAIAAVVEVTRTADGRWSDLGVADCVPAGDTWPNTQLPDGALSFELGGAGTLATIFTCTNRDDGTTFPLTLNVSWTAQLDLAGNWPLDSVPPGGDSSIQMLYDDVVSGVASDDTGPLIVPTQATGSLVRRGFQ